jgi:hypothetical protein
LGNFFGESWLAHFALSVFSRFQLAGLRAWGARFHPRSGSSEKAEKEFQRRQRIAARGLLRKEADLESGSSALAGDG